MSGSLYYEWHKEILCYVRKLLVCTLILLGLISCTPQDDYYAHYEAINQKGWHQNEELFFSVPTLSNKTEYEVSVALRLDRSIRYQEIPIGLIIESPNREIKTMVVKIPTTTDNLHIGGYNFFEKTYPITHSMHFDDEGVYSYSIRHLSTDSILNGIIEVGIIIEPSSK